MLVRRLRSVVVEPFGLVLNLVSRWLRFNFAGHKTVLARRLRSVILEQDLKLADTLRYYRRDAHAAKAMLVWRLRSVDLNPVSSRLRFNFACDKVVLVRRLRSAVVVELFGFGLSPVSRRLRFNFACHKSVLNWQVRLVVIEIIFWTLWIWAQGSSSML